MKVRNKKGFTLVELSIVLIIIGLIVTGIVAGKNLIDTARLSGARTVTQNSPVLATEGLVLWLDPTSTNAFLLENPENNDLITQFSDFNPQRSSQYTFDGVASHYPTYKRTGINGLPSLNFDATGATDYDVLKLNSGGILVNIVADRTLIFVVQPISPAESGNSTAIARNSSGTIDFGSSGGSDKLTLRDFDRDNITSSAVGSVTYGKPHIITIIGDSTGTKAYSDGTQIINVATQHFHYPIVGNTTGQGLKLGAVSNAGTLPERSFSGDLGEIILFDRSLNDAQRGIIENYLSQKWKIDLD